MKPTDLAFPDHVNLTKSQGHGKWHKMVEVNGVYMHGRYEREN